ncbi:MAG: DUF4157 domain-containing protein [Bacteroidota bacterium]
MRGYLEAQHHHAALLPIKSTANEKDVDMPTQATHVPDFGGSRTHYAALAAMPVIQPKLRVNPPNDRYEKEADAVAQQVVNTGGTEKIQSLPSISRVRPQAQRKCHRCEEEDQVLQRKGEGGYTANKSVSNGIQQALGGGEVMDTHTSTTMSSRFGTSFDHVRVHTGAKAAQMSEAVNAKAFTVGNDIFFNSGTYQPHTREGQRLLAHELTHVIQQSGRPKTLQRQPLEEDQEAKDGDYPQNVPAEATREALMEEQEEPILLAQADPKDKSKKTSKKTSKKKKKKTKRTITSIKVDLTEQTTTVTFSDGTAQVMQSSTGKGLTKNFQKENPATDRCKKPGKADSNCTPTGSFSIAKNKNGSLKKGGKSYKNGKGDAMAYYVEISGTGASGRGIGFHNSQIVNGRPMSHGCIRVSLADAKTINKGVTSKTKVTISGKANIPADAAAKRKAAKAKKKKKKSTKKSTPTGKTHTIKTGESLGLIAEKYGVSQKDLQELNKIKNPDKIKAGDILKIP